MELKKKANKAVFVYNQVSEIASKMNLSEVILELKDYKKDLESFKLYSENPTKYLQDYGDIAHNPLYSNRRRWLKSKGFIFHKDGHVAYFSPFKNIL